MTGVLEIQGHYGHPYRIHDPGDGVIGQALRTGEPYEAKFLYYVYRLGLRGAVVDAGAHVGNHALWFTCVCALETYAFEPVEHEALMANADLNPRGAPLLHMVPVALGAVAGTAALKRDSMTLEASDTGHIPVRTLDDYNLQDVRLIKADVEGWEPEVLLGGADTISRCRPIIFAEERDKAASERNEQTLRELNYKRTGNAFGATPLVEWVPC